MSKNHTLICCIALSAIALLKSDSQGEIVLFGVDHISGADDALVMIDPSSGTGTLVGSIGFGAVDMLTQSPNGSLYGFTQGGPLSNRLIRINTLTGAGTSITSFDVEALAAVAFDSVGNLFGVTRNGGGQTNQLLRLNTNSGGVTVVGNFDADFNGIAFNSNDELFAALITPSPRGLYRIDTSDASVTSIGPFHPSQVGGDIVRVNDITFDSNDRLLGIDDGVELLEIDSATGEATAIGPIGIGSIGGLAFADASAVPEPSSFVVLAMAGLFFLTRMRQQRTRLAS